MHARGASATIILILALLLFIFASVSLFDFLFVDFFDVLVSVLMIMFLQTSIEPLTLLFPNVLVKSTVLDGSLEPLSNLLSEIPPKATESP